MTSIITSSPAVTGAAVTSYTVELDPDLAGAGSSGAGSGLAELYTLMFVDQGGGGISGLPLPRAPGDSSVLIAQILAELDQQVDASVANRLSGEMSALGGMLGKLIANQANQSALRDEIGTLQAQLVPLRDARATADAEVTRLSGEIETTRADLDDARTRVMTLQTVLGTIDRAAEPDRYAQVEADIATANQQEQALRDQLNALQRSLSSAQQQVQQADEQIRRVEVTIETRLQDLSNLQNMTLSLYMDVVKGAKSLGEAGLAGVAGWTSFVNRQFETIFDNLDHATRYLATVLPGTTDADRRALLEKQRLELSILSKATGSSGTLTRLETTVETDPVSKTDPPSRTESSGETLPEDETLPEGKIDPDSKTRLEGKTQIEDKIEAPDLRTAPPEMPPRDPAHAEIQQTSLLALLVAAMQDPLAVPEDLAALPDDQRALALMRIVALTSAVNAVLDALRQLEGETVTPLPQPGQSLQGSRVRVTG